MIKKLVIFLIKLYQKAMPKAVRGRCRFVPSCSQYMIEAILKRGLIVGVALGIYRILRCNPFNKHCGLDKVPDKKSVVKWVY